MNGIRVPSVLIQRNGLLDNLNSIWITNANVLIICADPSDYEKNDSVCACLKESLPMSGLSISHIDKCDDRNPNAVNALESIDVLILAGGHVPTQNKFMDQLRLKERLMDFHGIVVAWSAGSMNCADTVYAGPELEGEAIDPLYERWITGLGLTDINIFPHFQSLKDDYLDGLRLIPERDQNIFLQRYFFFDDPEIIAARFGLKRTNVNLILSRTRSKLKTYLTQEGYYL